MLFFGNGAVALLLWAAGILVAIVIQPKAKVKAGRVLPSLMLVPVVGLAIHIFATTEVTYGGAALRLRGLAALVVWVLGGLAMYRLVRPGLVRNQVLLLVAGYVVVLSLVGTVAARAAAGYHFRDVTAHGWNGLESWLLVVANVVGAVAVVYAIYLIVWPIAQRFAAHFDKRADAKKAREAKEAADQAAANAAVVIPPPTAATGPATKTVPKPPTGKPRRWWTKPPPTP